MTDPAIRPPASDAERLDWVRLARSENVGPVTFLMLLRRFGSAAKALAAIPDLARRGGLKRAIRICPAAEAERELAGGARAGQHFLALGDGAYPLALAQIETPPPFLWATGNLSVLQKPAVALVGARNASASGIRLARDIAGALSAEGIVTVSGLARGIDSAAHVASLKTGTIGVVAGGADVIYPPENAELFAKVAETGAVVTEQAPGAEPKAKLFPRRNRIISGLSRGVVVIEAAERSGSLSTARFALDQNREVCAVPGSPLDLRCRGSNRLLKEGAALVENAADVLEAIGHRLHRPLGEPDSRQYDLPLTAPAAEDQVARGRAVLEELLSPTPTEIDELIRLSQLTAPVVLTILLELELAGRLQRQPGQKVALVETAPAF